MPETPIPRPEIGFVMDARLSPERTQLLMRAVNTLRRWATVHVFEGTTVEGGLIDRLTAKPVQLLIAPWHMYFKWNRLEAHFGLTRTSGPTFAGYFAEPLGHADLPQEPSGWLRMILLDFFGVSAFEISLVVQTLIKDTQRAGLLPLLKPQTALLKENWGPGEKLGPKLDRLAELPLLHSEFGLPQWFARRHGLRICLEALWSRVYEGGPSKAQFELGADERIFALRLLYPMKSSSPRSLLEEFSPLYGHQSSSPTARLLKQHGDLVRVHCAPDSPDIEIVVAFFPSAPAEGYPERLKSLWIEPLSSRIMAGSLEEELARAKSHVAALTGPTGKEKQILEAQDKIVELRRTVRTRDEQIRELRAGGVGVAPRLSPPDAEGLLEAFQERYFQARFEIRQLELQIAKAQKEGASPAEFQDLNLRIQALMNREQSWIRKLASTLEIYRRSRQGPGGGTKP